MYLFWKDMSKVEQFFTINVFVIFLSKGLEYMHQACCLLSVIRD